MILEPVKEDPADPARDFAVGNPEIFLGPFRKARIESRVVRGAGGAQPGVESIGIIGIGDRRVEIGPAAEPAFGGVEEAAVHVDRGDVRVGHVRDQADAGGEEARVDIRARDRGGEFWAELAVDGRHVDPRPCQISCRSSGCVRRRRRAFRLPWPSLSVPVPGNIVERGVTAGLTLDCLERRANPRAERFEPVARCLLLVVEGDHKGNSPVWRSASPKASAAAVARLSERTSVRIGIRTIASQAAATSGGTPALSWPSNRVSRPSNVKS